MEPTDRPGKGAGGWPLPITSVISRNTAPPRCLMRANNVSGLMRANNVSGPLFIASG